MAFRPPIFAGLIVSGILAAPGLSGAELSRVTSGNILGVVADASGARQMGATVFLLNRFERPVARAVTNDNGQFGFDALLPDVYSIKVTLTSFVPAFKSNVLVEAGRSSFLNIHLASLMSSIELFYSSPGAAKLMSDEWKWVLRSSISTRPVLRFDVANPAKTESQQIFSGTHGVLRVSAGDSAGTSSYANQQDLGTAFAMATSVFGAAQVGVSGNFGYSAASGMPTAGFQTRLRRSDSGTSLIGLNPELRLTMRQVFLPNRVAGAVLSGSSNAPALRSMTIALAEKQRITDELLLEYGFALDSVSFVERLNYLSPYARLSYDLGNIGSFEVGYSSGAPPVELLDQRREGAAEGGNELNQSLAALGMFPRVSLRNGRAQVQRTTNWEIGYRKTLGHTVVSVAAYRESVGNAGLTMAGAGGFFPLDDLLPDLNSHSSVFNIGGFRRMGFSGSVQQNFTDNLSATLTVGRNGVLRTESRELLTGDPEELRAAVRQAQRPFATLRVSGVVPKVGTRISSSYQWTDFRALTPGHVYLTQRTYPDAGFNMSVRQPIPGFPGMPGRMELNADGRNLLAQGYLPLTTPDNRQLLLIHTPRSVRGGVSFFF